MQVVLLEDVKSLGKKGQVVSVNDGYARNYILPKKLGIEANSKNMNELKLQKQHQEKLEAQALAEAQELASKIGTFKVELKVKTGEGGKIFGSVSTKEIAAAVKEQYGIDLDKKKMQLSEPIKTVGSHIIPVRIHKDVTAQLTLKVTEG
ncbi:50S ribosomal protein L9 [Lachnotalea sp. AF33-28]|jgi:large subunit ribosomal protein L9|uniref:50S ribosomal protein L9 n=1 Tax=Lachnotalea sp. AF33-28 TaxID=2292046 RepID=UPI000E485523|nr:50S ribosomal protein L9 [Lachnotalea sp. AF33-28]RHP36467.1 50S ribosomal protein L9 [Lachnotalea sp. AF33-28]